MEIIDEMFSLMSTPGIMEKLIAIIAVDEESLKNAIQNRGNVNTEGYFEKLFALKIKVPQLNAQLYEYFLMEKIGLEFNKKGSPFQGKTISFSDSEIKGIISWSLC